MPDVYTTIADQDDSVVEQLAAAMELRAQDPTQRAFVRDYATITFTIGPNDPLQACAAAFQESYINDPFVMRRALSMVLTAGFEDAQVRSHGYVQVERPDYMLSVADRGADPLAAGGMLDQAGAAALKAEARRRVSDGRFFGHIAYLSIVARKPSP